MSIHLTSRHFNSGRFPDSAAATITAHEIASSVCTRCGSAINEHSCGSIVCFNMVRVCPSNFRGHIRSGRNNPLKPSLKNNLRAPLARLSGLCPVIMCLYVRSRRDREFCGRRQIKREFHRGGSERPLKLGLTGWLFRCSLTPVRLVHPDNI